MPTETNSQTDNATRTDPRLLELLICPVSRTPLIYDREAQELVSKRAQLAYPIRNGLPIMLESEARALDGGAGV
jgi:uncharacterized protein YbaR (Trm112 family)